MINIGPFSTVNLVWHGVTAHMREMPVIQGTFNNENRHREILTEYESRRCLVYPSW